ncbi:MAG: alpha/beta hydrolase [Candidatus Cohnella colombiensis]|uniref:Alpha/beta hydrolase n=1 Tax=Candidatus Cohnella colombiensis TaxID=3121368 RepID=A0AA95JB68_9BACL|nr:MAG: alpha/beta hydrolase [Cohnella sp.]
MMFYKDTGSGLPIVLLHGYCGSHKYWDEVVPQLARNYRVITMDLPGHGQSAPSNMGYSMEQLAEQIIQLLDQLGLQQVYLFGHSLGGYISLALVERYADRLLGLGLIHSTSYPDSDAAKENRLKAVASIEKEGIVPFVNGLIPKLFASDNHQAVRESMEKAIEIGYGTSVDGAIGCALGMRERRDRKDVLERIQMPTLLLAGALDEVIAEDRRFPVSGPTVTAVTLENVGHMGMMESPDAFVNGIVNYLGESR